MKLEEEMPTPIVVELKPNRLLLDPKFDGYKLSLEPLPSYVAALPRGADRVIPSESHYSIQHAKLFGQHNALIADPWNPSLFFLVDKEWKVCRVYFDTELQVPRFDLNEEVWVIPTRDMRKPGRFNPSLKFCDETKALFADGCGNLFLLETGNRMLTSKWTVLKNFKFKESEVNGMDQFVILDTTCYQENNEDRIDYLLMRICDKNDPKWTEFFQTHSHCFTKSNVNHPFVTTIDWITLAIDGNGSWSIRSTRTLVGPSGIDYASLEPFGTGIILASENHFAYIHISDQPMKYSKNSSDSPPTESDKKEYLWMQTDDEVMVWFRIPLDAKKQDFNIEIKPSSISISSSGSVMLEGTFLHKVDPEESTWTLAAANSVPLPTDDESPFKSLEIVLQKSESGVVWEDESFVKGNIKGQQILDPELAKEIHERLKHLCSDKWDANPVRKNAFDPQQLEECDSFPADTTSIMRIDRNLQCITHSASLGSHQWLFNAKVDSQKTPAICIRHDIDGIVWQPIKVSTDPSTNSNDVTSWKLEHLGTFSALGYVQASKQQRKFTVCPPDLSYVAICDAVKHLYIYRQPLEIGSDLRNRITGERINHIAKQQIFAIEPPIEIVGAYADNRFLYILTTQNFHAIRIKEVIDD